MHHATMLLDVVLKCCERLARPLVMNYGHAKHGIRELIAENHLKTDV